jgi:hypothetical protein
MISRFNTSKFFSEEILTRPAGSLGREMCSPAAEFMCPGQLDAWLFQTLIRQIRSHIPSLVSHQETLLLTARRQTVTWISHVTQHDSLVKTVPQGNEDGGRCRECQKELIRQCHRMDHTDHAGPYSHSQGQSKVGKGLQRSSSLRSPQHPDKQYASKWASKWELLHVWPTDFNMKMSINN